MSNTKGLDGFVSMLVNNLIGDSYDKVVIGNISEELRKKFKAMHKRKDDLEKELSTRKDILQAEMELALYKEFNTRMDEFDDEKVELWTMATNELGVDPDGNYSVNHQNGVVSKKIKKGENPFMDVNKGRKN